MENFAELIGMIDKPFTKEYSRNEVDYYKGNIRIKRDSGTEDIIPVITCHRKITGHVKVLGSFRSHTDKDTGALDLYVLADGITSTYQNDSNSILLLGNICKVNKIRKTPRGKWICDFILAVNNSKSSYYIPCIAWGSLAYDISNFYMVGDLVEISGRIQSRNYVKESGCLMIEKTAYEISANSIERL